MCRVSLCSGMLLAIKHWGWILTEWHLHKYILLFIHRNVWSKELYSDVPSVFPVYCPSIVSLIVMMILIFLLTTKCAIDMLWGLWLDCDLNCAMTSKELICWLNWPQFWVYICFGVFCRRWRWCETLQCFRNWWETRTGLWAILR